MRPKAACKDHDQVSEGPKPASEGPKLASGGDGKTDGLTDGRTDGRTYVRTDRFPLYSTGLCPPLGAAALLTWELPSSYEQSRARVPMTISCLWATGSSIYLAYVSVLEYLSIVYCFIPFLKFVLNIFIADFFDYLFTFFGCRTLKTAHIVAL